MYGAVVEPRVEVSVCSVPPPSHIHTLTTILTHSSHSHGAPTLHGNGAQMEVGAANSTQEDLRWDSNPQPLRQFVPLLPTGSTKAVWNTTFRHIWQGHTQYCHKNNTGVSFSRTTEKEKISELKIKLVLQPFAEATARRLQQTEILWPQMPCGVECLYANIFSNLSAFLSVYNKRCNLLVARGKNTA